MKSPLIPIAIGSDSYKKATREKSVSSVKSTLIRDSDTIRITDFKKITQITQILSAISKQHGKIRVLREIPLNP